MVSEAVTNALKHSKASQLEVRLRAADGVLAIEVVDDGIGGATARRGSGLRGLADRVDMLGGRFSVHSPEGCGTQVRVDVPCAA